MGKFILQKKAGFVFMKSQLETPFKGDNVKALIKCQIVKNWSFISLTNFRKLQHLLCIFGFQ